MRSKVRLRRYQLVCLLTLSESNCWFVGRLAWSEEDYALGGSPFRVGGNGDTVC